MGWSSAVAFGCGVDEKSMRQQVDLMESSGLRDSGYVTFILGCGWQAIDRAKDGTFAANQEAFPSGMDGMAKYVHGKKMQFGLTSTAGSHPCGTRVKAHSKMIGSQDHEASDVKTFVRWGIDFLKMEFCWADNPHTPVDYNPKFSVKDRFKITRDALIATAAPVTYAISAWGIQNPLSWPVKDYANLWRIGDDVAAASDTWNRVVRTINQFASEAWANEPGTFVDLDLLEVGQGGLSRIEVITQFTFWAAAKSPLIISTDLNRLDPGLIRHLKNPKLIAVNQDPLGASVRLRRRYTDQHDVWSGPLKDGSVVVVIVNFLDDTLLIDFNLGDLGYLSANILDLWTEDALDVWNTTIPLQTSAHGVQLLKLTEMVPKPPVKYQKYPAIGQNCDLYGMAAKRVTGTGLAVAGNVGKGSYIQWHDVDGGEQGGRKYVTLDYIMADSELVIKSDCPRCREGYISVNGGPEVKLNFPASGNSWDDVYRDYLLEMDGFTPGPTNKIKITNGNALTPDFVNVGVQI